MMDVAVVWREEPRSPPDGAVLGFARRLRGAASRRGGGDAALLAQRPENR